MLDKKSSQEKATKELESDKKQINLNDMKDLSILDLFKNRYLKKINYIYCILIFASGFSYVSS